MASALLQSISGVSAGAVVSFPLAFSQNMTKGSLLVAAQGTAATGTSFTTSDPTNGSWGVGRGASAQTSSNIRFINNTASGAGITVTSTPATTQQVWLTLMEFASTGTSVVDVSQIHSTASSTAASTGPSPSIASAGEIVVGNIIIGASETITLDTANSSPGTQLITTSPNQQAVLWNQSLNSSALNMAVTLGLATSHQGVIVAFTTPIARSAGFGMGGGFIHLGGGYF